MILAEASAATAAAVVEFAEAAVVVVVVRVVRNTVPLPLGSRAVALTKTWLVVFVELGAKTADDAGVSGHTVATGTWITVVGKR
jgi:hypothetical protein